MRAKMREIDIQCMQQNSIPKKIVFFSLSPCKTQCGRNNVIFDRALIHDLRFF